MAALSDLLVKLDMDSASFRAELNRAGNELGKFGEQIAKAGELVKHALEFEIIKESAAKLFEFVAAGAEAAEQLEHLSQRSGIASEELQKLEYAATVAGVSHEQMAKGLDKLAKNMAIASSGTGTQAKAFEAMGVSVKDAEGKLRPTSEVLGDIAEKFSHYKDSAEKSALAQELFGKTGAELIPFLNLGKQGFEQLGDEAQRFGIILSDETVEASAHLAADLKKLHAASEGFKNVLAAEMAPALDVFAQQLLDGAKNGGELRSAMDGLGQSLKYVLVFGEGVAFEFQVVIKTFAGLAAAINDLDINPKIAAFAPGTALIAAVMKNGKKALDDLKYLGGDLAKELETTGAKMNEILDAQYKKLEGEHGPEKKGDAPNPLGKAVKEAKDSLAIIDAMVKAALALQKEDERERGAILEDAYKNGATSLKDYYDQRMAMLQEASGNEIEFLQEKIDEAQRLEAKAEPKDKIKYQAKLIELNGQLELAEAKMLNSSADLQRKATDATLLHIKAVQDLAIANGEKLNQASIVEQADVLQHQRALMTISNSDYYAGLKKLEQQSLSGAIEIEREKYANIIGSDEAQILAKQAINDRIIELERNSAEKIKQIDRQMELDRVKFSIEAENSIKSNLESGIAAFLDGSKTLKQVFKDLANSIIADIARMEAKKFVESFLGAGTSGGNILNGILGVAGSFGGAASVGTTAAPILLGGTGLNATSAFSGALAGGGPAESGLTYLVGEDGPEMFTPNVSGNITPNHAMGGNITQNFAISAPNGQVSRESQMQVAAAAARGMAAANRRNN